LLRVWIVAITLRVMCPHANKLTVHPQRAAARRHHAERDDYNLAHTLRVRIVAITLRVMCPR
jgi:hypothetical protein